MYSKIQRQGIWHDTQKDCKVPVKSDQCIYFPSKSEYDLYLYLKSQCNLENIQLKVHPKVGVYGRSWVIDFALIANDLEASKKLATINNQINGTNFDYLEQIYIEYKGIQDDNFTSKMAHFCTQSPTLASTISLISSNTSAFGCENLLCKGILTKPIVSVNTFKKWFGCAIVGKSTFNGDDILCHEQ